MIIELYRQRPLAVSANCLCTPPNSWHKTPRLTSSNSKMFGAIGVKHCVYSGLFTQCADKAFVNIRLLRQGCQLLNHGCLHLGVSGQGQLKGRMRKPMIETRDGKGEGMASRGGEGNARNLVRLLVARKAGSWRLAKVDDINMRFENRLHDQFSGFPEMSRLTPPTNKCSDIKYQKISITISDAISHLDCSLARNDTKGSGTVDSSKLDTAYMR